MSLEEFEFDADDVVEAHTALVGVVVAATTPIEFTKGAFSVTRIAGPTGAIESCSATTSRSGQATHDAERCAATNGLKEPHEQRSSVS